ncbi:unnamed protein product [Tuber aestivum]|uniref:Ribonuclease H n=1 Tax=Tuber aestivum TaxID=59557 RepID=A0A292Q6E7_9PEZI|nr:unnamed protein product [Tuber aestivum]
MKYYAVRAGFHPGVYTAWPDCLSQITGFKGAKFKSFPTEEEAQLFLSGVDPTLDPNSASYTAKYYGVRSGKNPGVYTDWATAEQQVVGVQKPKVRCFATREEAEAFVNGGGSGGVSPVSVDDRKRPVRVGVGDIAAPSKASVYGREGSSELEDRVPVPKKRKSVGNNLNQEEAELKMALLCAPPMLEETVPQEMHPDEDAVLRSLNRHLRGEGDETSDEDSSDSGATLVNNEEVKPKPRVIAKKSSILRIYTDGSALHNGKPSAIAGVGVWFGDKDSSRNISEPLPGPRQTNSRAELTAILRAINVAPKHREVAIYTDSEYAINCVTVWHINWSKNNWITSVGRPVENQDLIVQILERLRERESYGSKTHFEWVRGHTGQNDGNSQADRLAVQGARIAEALINRRY